MSIKFDDDFSRIDRMDAEDGDHGGGSSKPKPFDPVLAMSFELIPPPNHTDDYNRKKDLIASDKIEEHRAFAWLRPITEEEVRDSLAKEVKKHSCWKAKAVQKLQIEDLKFLTCLHYTLETFTEARSTSKSSEPYSLGQFIESGGFDQSDDSFLNDIWALDCQPRQEFYEEIRVFEVPGTSELVGCTTCSAEGVSHCFHCRGNGTDQCKYCRGTGMKAGIPHPAVYTHPMMGGPHMTGFQMPGSSSHGGVIRRGHGDHSMAYGKGTPMHYMNVSGIPPPGIGTHDLCIFCHGNGIQECAQCRGQGKKTCGPCGGSGSMRQFLKLKVKFGVERTDYFHQEGGVPEDLLRQVSGEIVLAEQKEHVLPIRSYPVESINENSKRLCSIHLQKCLGSCKMIQQRHTLEAVPVAEVSYKLGNKSGKFWVYGQERLCFVPNYPAKCSIL